jgi:hypothetical protein
MSNIGSKIIRRIGPVLLLALVLMSAGCTDKDNGIEIKKGGHYSVMIPAEKGDELHIKWNTEGEIQWQLSDDNNTIVPGNPQDIVGFNNVGEEYIKIKQNATYTLTFENLDERKIDIELVWEIK